MGATETQQGVDRNFPMQNYLNQGLNRNQVMMVRAVFNSYHPKDGCIQTHRYRESLVQSGVKDVAIERLDSKDTLDFDEFFAIEKEVLLVQLRKNPQLELDSTQVDPPSNFLCPYAQ